MIGHLTRRAKAEKLFGRSRHKRSLLMQGSLNDFFLEQQERVARNLKYQKPDDEVMHQSGIVKDILELDHRR